MLFMNICILVLEIPILEGDLSYRSSLLVTSATLTSALWPNAIITRQRNSRRVNNHTKKSHLSIVTIIVYKRRSNIYLVISMLKDHGSCG